MTGIRKPSTELDQLAAGLGNAEDPYFLKPLEKETPQGLAAAVNTEIRFSTVSMIRAGRYFMAIKKRLGHGKWEEFVIAQRWRWNYVRCCMKLLEVAARFPQALHLPGGRVIERVLHLPAPEIEGFLADQTAETLKKLTPWDIERIYDQKRDEMRKTHRRKKNLTDEEAAEILAKHNAEMADKAWANICKLYGAAVGAMNLLADAAEEIEEMRPEYFDRIFDRHMVDAIARPYDRLIVKWRPREEVRRRALQASKK